MPEPTSPAAARPDDLAATPAAARRMVLVHAHPDDETIGSGVTMAKYVAEGAHVTLVTCTGGEEGEVLVPELEHLAADRDDALGPQRVIELADAMRALGVTDHRYLGGFGRFRDSGMMGTPPNERPDAFWRADLAEAATLLVEILREVRPQVVVTYDDFGGYGHPDHLQAHRVATYAVALAGVVSFRPDLGAAWDVPKVYWTTMPRSALQKGIDAMTAAGETGFFGVESADEFPFAVDDELVTTAIDGIAFEPAKLDAMRAHATQITVDGPFFALSNNVGLEAMGIEHYRIAKGTAVREGDQLEDDLFAGLPV
jgi:N-acetyl-1-D-myo-inositol-2-amino-2-deoxy-alpha-D-glucopyranoside deacetylase